jgi:hypothetical protein
MIDKSDETYYLGAQTKAIPCDISFDESIFNFAKSYKVCPFFPQSMLIKRASMFYP